MITRPKRLISVRLIALLSLVLILGSGFGANPPNPYRYGSNNLIDASPGEVAQFALDFVQATHQVRSGKPQVLLSRAVTGEDIMMLGLGCMPDSATIEEPPLVLVILKGDFSPNMPGGGLESATYMAFAFDVWAAKPMSTWASRTGVGFRTALNDPTLPEGSAGLPNVCPTPAAPATLHYGDTAPAPTAPKGPELVGISTPTVPPLPTPLLTIPMPVPTVLPVPSPQPP